MHPGKPGRMQKETPTSLGNLVANLVDGAYCEVYGNGTLSLRGRMTKQSKSLTLASCEEGFIKSSEISHGGLRPIPRCLPVTIGPEVE